MNFIAVDPFLGKLRLGSRVGWISDSTQKLPATSHSFDQLPTE